MSRILLAAVEDARRFLKSYFASTPLVAAPSLSKTGATAFLKLECQLPTGSFKPRGALYALNVNLKRRKITEVTASSTGNHGAAVAFAAKTLGVPATIFLPANPNPVKQEKIRALGARLVETGAPDLAQAFQEAADYSRRDGVYFLNDATDPDLPAGPGTIGLEIAERLPQVSSVYVPMGDTALIRGLAAAIKYVRPEVKVIGVQAERAPSYCLSWKQGNAVSTDSCDTCADGLATRTPDPENVRDIRQFVDEVVLVSEEQMIDAIRHLYERENVLAEPAGAAATAAFLASSHQEGLTVLLVSGANISGEVKQRAGIG
ncbi:MAG TPA: pyridoxal-phosphate dependent enzyme [Terriglobales bacterium]|jgi:threonine dehydratase